MKTIMSQSNDITFGLILLFVPFFLVACNNKDNRKELVDNNENVTEAALDFTSTPPTKTVTPISMFSDEIYQSYCPNDQEVLLSELPLTQSILLGENLVDNPKASILIYLPDLKEISHLIDVDPGAIELSPNGHWIVYQKDVQENQTQEVWLVDIEQGAEIKVADTLPDNLLRARWAGHEKLILWSVFEDDLTGRQERYGRPTHWLEPPFSELHPIPTMPRSIRQSVIFLNADASKAFFVFEEDGRKAVIYDMQTQQVKEVPGISYDTRFSWSPGGEKFAIESGEIFIFDTNTLTITNRVNLDPLEKGAYLASHLNWSTNSDKFVFALNYFLEDEIAIPPQGLYVFDNQVSKLSYYCLELRSIVHNLHWLHWSSDDRFLAWAQEEPNETIILDTQTGHFAKIPGYILLGWGISD